MINYRLKAQLIQVVENQLDANDPKCARRTLNRLMDLGYEEDESKEMIASVLVEEIFDVTKNKEKYNEKRYCKKLAKLPEHVETLYKDETVSEDKVQVQVQVVNEPKIGRNDSCPCGSGKKYKKCCG